MAQEVEWVVDQSEGHWSESQAAPVCCQRLINILNPDQLLFSEYSSPVCFMYAQQKAFRNMVILKTFLNNMIFTIK